MSPISQPNPATHTRSKLIESFHVSGFIYYDGALVFDQLAIGKKPTLRREPDNHYDANAIALYYGVHKLGFVPRDSNHTIAKVMDAGYDLFEGVVQQIDPTQHPAQQIRVGIFIIPAAE